MRDCTVRECWILGSASLLIAVAIPVTGCGSALGTDEAADAGHVEITGESPIPLLLVSSTNWLHGFDDETGEELIALIDADTVEVDLPVQQTVALTDTYRIYFEIINPSDEDEASIRMQVHLDDKLMFDESATMRDASMSFSYFYR